MNFFDFIIAIIGFIGSFFFWVIMFVLGLIAVIFILEFMEIWVRLKQADKCKCKRKD